MMQQVRPKWEWSSAETGTALPSGAIEQLFCRRDGRTVATVWRRPGGRGQPWQGTLASPTGNVATLRVSSCAPDIVRHEVERTLGELGW